MSVASFLSQTGFSCQPMRRSVSFKAHQTAISRLGHRTSVVRRSIATQQSAESWNDGAYLSESILSSSAAVASFRQTKDGVDFENLPPELFKDEIYPMLEVRSVAHSAVTVRTTQLVKEVLHLLKDHTGFPVTNPATGKIVGIVSMKDIFGKSEWATIEDVMTTPTIVVCPETQILVAAGVMLQHNVHRLPVVLANDPGTCVGIVTRSDIFSHPITETEAEEILENL